MNKNMLALCILAFSLFALIQFGVSQWRAIWISTAAQPLSDAWQLRVGMDSESVGPRDFATIMSLGEQLSPGLRKGSAWLSEVSVYYKVLAMVHKLLGVKLAPVSAWTLREMQTCSRYAAVVLDQGLSMNLDRRLAAHSN